MSKISRTDNHSGKSIDTAHAEHQATALVDVLSKRVAEAKRIGVRAGRKGVDQIVVFDQGQGRGSGACVKVVDGRTTDIAQSRSEAQIVGARGGKEDGFGGTRAHGEKQG